jgi:hypothetical protein
MSQDFLINTPNHKRWWLPDRRHWLDSFMFGDAVKISVIRSYDQSTVLSSYIDMKKDNWDDLCQLAYELAEKRFRDDRIKTSLPRQLQRFK